LQSQSWVDRCFQQVFWTVVCGVKSSAAFSACWAPGTECPPPPQNFSSSSFENRQSGQGWTRCAPHPPQNRRPSRLSAQHWGHCMESSRLILSCRGNYAQYSHLFGLGPIEFKPV